MTNRRRPTLMFEEAATAGSALSRQVSQYRPILDQVRKIYENSPPPLVITCARGSSDHAATYLRYLFETRAGILTTSLAPSVASLYGKWPHIAGELCVAISQSGKSTDLLMTMEGLKRAGVASVALVNDASSPLAGLTDFVLPLLAGEERSVAATKTFIATMFAALQLANAVAPGLISSAELDAAPALLSKAWELDWAPLVDCLVDAQGLYVIGRGIGLSVAGEAALKFKETCGLHAEAYSAAEVRHGPMALFDNEFPVLIFRQSDASAEGNDELAELAVNRGCPVFVIGGNTAGATNLPSIEAQALLEPILQIQTFYKAVNELSLRRGRNPDNPPLLKKVTVTL